MNMNLVLNQISQLGFVIPNLFRNLLTDKEMLK